MNILRYWSKLFVEMVTLASSTGHVFVYVEMNILHLTALYNCIHMFVQVVTHAYAGSTD